MSILLLGGSPSVPSSSSRLLLHIGEKLAAQGHRYQRVHVRDLPPRALLLGDGADAAIRRAIGAVAAAHAIVIATPIYKASYSGLLKTFLDLLPQDGLAGKVILPIATGGSQSHMLALDYALRPVLHALAARQVLTGIYATTQQLEWHDEEGLSLAAPIAARVAAGVDELAAALAPPQQARLVATAAAAQAAPVRSLQDHPYTPSIQAA
ncbi:NADPH-dependent FMN reductase [Pseudoduganella sp. LjRoot289]|uniref:NADPH-dependent FMN reductase n=1 Tax=Pseudoduganella sp. LjRoot289 TaxID=3342314 RepID=UPI003ECC7598